MPMAAPGEGMRKMDKAGQYGEPWRYAKGRKGQKFRRHILAEGEHVGSMVERHGARATLCVNALASLSDEQLSQDPIAKARKALQKAENEILYGAKHDALKYVRAALALLGDKS